MTTRTALVVGATGIIGGALVRRLAREPGWQVLAMSRRDPLGSEFLRGLRPDVTVVRADLTDANAVRAAIEGHRVTHVFYAASKFSSMGAQAWPRTLQGQQRMFRKSRRMRPLLPVLAFVLRDRYWNMMNDYGGLGEVTINDLMFRNVLSAVTEAPHAIEHVQVVTGGRNYGHHLGPLSYRGYTSPFVEDVTPRSPGTNWYHLVEDHLIDCAARQDFRWTVLRPSTLVGGSLTTDWNVGTALACYASIVRHLGQPLHFPGTAASWEAGACFTDARLLADMMLWAVDEPAAYGQALHCVNGGPSSWSAVWPAVARHFGLEPVRSPEGFCVEELLTEHPRAWDDLVAEHGLAAVPLRDLCGPAVLDRSCATSFDAIYSMDKARAAGFSGAQDDGESFCALFADMEAAKLIPPTTG